ncbi:COX assembly mitochondrial protein homolog isoform X2 [Delphinus delphis]|uniref:COX assembly mitochondrial protein homolog isoform X2 n=1 Tax=Delphinus delphis TaxID=9728 RepID=UPI0028C38DCA|nr:COX assembly mitochondrial protein homolog isoform X2 [Delphinus delphis]
MAHGPSHSTACGILPDRGTNPCPLHRQADSQPLRHQGSPVLHVLESYEQHLRHVEKDVLIPKIMREKARERCSEQVQDFTKCCKDSGILMVVKCRKENSALKECLTAYYNDPAFYEECKMEYLKEREEFRKTGIPTKKRLQKLPTSM